MLGPHKQPVTSTEFFQVLFHPAHHWGVLKAGIKLEGGGRQDLDGKIDGVGGSLVPALPASIMASLRSLLAGGCTPKPLHSMGLWL